MPLRNDLIRLEGLPHIAFQHSMDAAAAQRLEKFSSFRGPISKVLLIAERQERYNSISGKVRVSEIQYPGLYREYQKMATVLDLRSLPELYIETADEANAFAFGIENYTITLNTALLDMLDEQERYAIIGHELGHVKCEHVFYKTLAAFLTFFGGPVLDVIPVPGIKEIFGVSLQIAVLEWNRRAEFSCDRAALLATQNPAAVASALGKLAGYSESLGEQLDLEALRTQANQFDEFVDDSLIAKAIKLASLLDDRHTHPYPVLRVKEIMEWAESNDYRRILSGDFVPVPPPPKMGLLCPKDRHVNPIGTTYCLRDSTSLRGAPLVCGNCLSAVAVDYNFCPNPDCTHDFRQLQDPIATGVVTRTFP